ncbi:MAG TPA: helix-turn-helix transcriptional regulator [Candidatus Saccharimonadales bacterium]|nr:helix-turn-helix transcriptional regulator [Candidatus Saccharimonadales bacterium]
MGRFNKEAINQEDKEKLQKKFGKRLAEIRNEKEITQENFAFEAGVDRTYISYLERGKRNPSLYMLSRLAKALRVSLNELTNI